MKNIEIQKYILEDDDNLDLLTPELLDVDKNNLIVQNKKKNDNNDNKKKKLINKKK